MKHRRRAAALGLSLFALGAFVSAPAARAQTAPADVSGSARGVGLELSLLGNGLTLGLTTASGDTSAKAVAEGAGQANPLVPGTATKAEAATGSEPVEEPQKCDAIVPPEVSGPIGLNLGLACSSASASVNGRMPTATSTASVAEASLNANTLLDTLGLGDPVEEATGQIIEQLQPIFGGLAGTPLEGVVTTVSDLLDDVLNTETLRLRAGPGSSSVVGTETGFVATGTGQGAVIDLLPTGALDPTDPTAPGRPVATI